MKHLTLLIPKHSLSFSFSKDRKDVSICNDCSGNMITIACGEGWYHSCQKYSGTTHSDRFIGARMDQDHCYWVEYLVMLLDEGKKSPTGATLSREAN